MVTSLLSLVNGAASMSSWQPIRVLLNFRYRAAANDFAENPTAYMGRGLLVLVLAATAFSLGNALGGKWADLDGATAGARLNRLWLMTQIFWILALLLPNVVTLLGGNPPRSVLRMFPLSPVQSFTAALLASLLDAPTAIAALALLPFVAHLLLQGQWSQVIVALIAFGALGLQSCALARLLIDGGALIARRLRRWAEIPAIAALMLACLCIGMPPAFASLITAPPQNPNSIHITWPSFPQVDPTPALPSGLACRAVLAARYGDVPGVGVSFAALALLTGTTAAGAFAAFRGANRVPGASDRVNIAGNAIHRLPRALSERTGALPQLACLLVTEWRLLLRKPETYLPLRQPAGMLLLGVMAFLSPDMGRDPIYNLKELLGLGGVLYNALWQIQLLCNRFGSESGTASLLFSLSTPRWLLLLGKNLALLLFLCLLDSAALAGLCVVAEAPQNIPWFLLWLPLTLLMLTALGNVVSVLLPFSIARPSSQNRNDAPESLAFGYLCIGAGAALLLMPAAGLFARGAVGVAAAFAYVLLLYLASLCAATSLLKRHERQMIARLDRSGE